MESAVLMTLAIVAVVIIASALPLVGLIALAWAGHAWVGPYGAIVICLCWGRYGGPLIPPTWWPARPPG